MRVGGRRSWSWSFACPCCASRFDRCTKWCTSCAGEHLGSANTCLHWLVPGRRFSERAEQQHVVLGREIGKCGKKRYLVVHDAVAILGFQAPAEQRCEKSVRSAVRRKYVGTKPHDARGRDPRQHPSDQVGRDAAPLPRVRDDDRQIGLPGRRRNPAEFSPADQVPVADGHLGIPRWSRPGRNVSQVRQRQPAAGPSKESVGETGGRHVRAGCLSEDFVPGLPGPGLPRSTLPRGEPPRPALLRSTLFWSTLFWTTLFRSTLLRSTLFRST